MSRCACNLPIDPPAHLRWWRPDLDREPDPPVCAAIRWGDDPRQRRAVRLGDGAGWAEYGDKALHPSEIAVPMNWSCIGLCQHNTPHPVVAVWQPPGHSGCWAYHRDDQPTTASPGPEPPVGDHVGQRSLVHVVLERGTSWSVPSDYLGWRVTDDPDPRGVYNIGHVIAMVRESKHLIRPGQCVRVYLEGQRPQRWRLDSCNREPDPIISELIATTKEQICGAPQVSHKFGYAEA